MTGHRTAVRSSPATCALSVSHEIPIYEALVDQRAPLYLILDHGTKRPTQPATRRGRERRSCADGSGGEAASAVRSSCLPSPRRVPTPDAVGEFRDLSCEIRRADLQRVQHSRPICFEKDVVGEPVALVELHERVAPSSPSKALEVRRRSCAVRIRRRRARRAWVHRAPAARRRRFAVTQSRWRSSVVCGAITSAKRAASEPSGSEARAPRPARRNARGARA